MKHADELFQLIKSLSRNEKRYFRLFSSLQKGDKSYLQFFDSLDSLEEYDEQKFRKDNKEKKFIRNFAWRKHHLYDSILKSLEAYHQSVDSKGYSLIHRAEILYEKTLYHQCIKILSKAKRLAQEYETQPLLLEALRMEKKIARKEYDLQKQGRLMKEQSEQLAIAVNEMEYANLFQKIYAEHNKIGIFRSKQDEKRIEKIIRSNLFRNESQALSFTARRNFFYSHFLYCFMKGDAQQGFAYAKKNVDEFLARPEQISYDVQLYISALNAFLYCCTVQRKYKEMAEYLAVFFHSKNFFTTRNDRIAALLIVYHELGYYSLTGQFKKGVEAAKRIEHEIEEYGDALPDMEKFSLYTNLAIMYFINQQYRDAAHCLNYTINSGKLRVRTDMESMIRLLNIITHFERGSSRAFIKSLVRSTYRLLVKKHRLYKFETIMLEFIRKKLIKASSQEDIIRAFKNLRQELIPLTKNSYESRPLEYFDLIAWLTSKIENRPFAELIRQKNIR